jgi:pimeloyl-ACP methyl ester carboxylesterase
VLEPLAQSHRVIAVDLPGFGASGKPLREYSADFFLSTLHDLLGQLGLKEATLVGNSFGGQIAMLYALSHPGFVAKLVLVDSGGFQRYTDEEKAFTETNFGEPVLAALTPEIHAIIFAPLFARASETSRRYLERQNAKLRRPDYPAYAHVLASSVRLALSTYLLDRLPEIQCPVLLVWGEQDQVLPAAQASQAMARLRHGQLKVIPGCGHAPQLECPREFLEAIGPFLDEPRQ